MPAGQRVVVTAGASGIGLAIARAFVANGATVHICDINEGALRAATQAHQVLEAHHPRAETGPASGVVSAPMVT